MTIPCMRLLARAGSSCPVLYPRSRVLSRCNGARTGVYGRWGSRSTARSLVTMLCRTAKPDDEDDDFIPELRDSIIEAIQKRGITSRRYVVLQATPSFSHLVSDPIFLRESIDRAVKTAGYRIHRVEAVAVVIDSIPKTKSSPYSEGWSLMVTDRVMRFFGDTSAAYGNFEFKPAPLADIPIGYVPKLPIFERSRNPDDDRGNFQMVFRAVNTDYTPQNNQTKILNRKKEFLHIKTKMANTIFQNGMPSTAMVHKYRVDGDEDGSNARLHPELVRRTKDLTVRLSGAQVWETRVNYCLRKLTEPRKVYKGIGNIIKKLKGPDGKEIMNASQELEEAVADLTVKRPIYDPVTLEKRPLEIFARIASDNTNILGQRVPEAGVRFAKVLAGGGGWGLNAGILALDPEVIQGYKPPGKLAGYIKELGDSGPTSINGKWVTFYSNDPMKWSARARKDRSLGQWKFIMVGKGDTLGPDATFPAADLPSEPTSSDAVAGILNTTEGASQRPPTETAPVQEETKLTRKPHLPAQSLQTGADTALWVNGHKLDIPTFSILLDLLLETGEANGVRVPVRYVGKYTGEQKMDRIIGKKKNKSLHAGLTLMNRKYDFEGQKYEAELLRARSNDGDGAAVVEGEDLGQYQQIPDLSASALSELKGSIVDMEIPTDKVKMIEELEALHQKQGWQVDVGATAGAVSWRTDRKEAQRNGSVPSQLPPSKPSEQPDGSRANGEKSDGPGLNSEAKKERSVEEGVRDEPETVPQGTTKSNQEKVSASVKEV
ncbi:hypothetical protein TWF718_008584 [Orbilia javanica]|uniref:Uncharacterized protein n=1 Tax=Orbilia javanica TaxID=47235 RepID=A0AAN8N0P7_9PEZI